MTALGLLSLRDLLPAWLLAAWVTFAALVPLLLLLAMALRRRGLARKPAGLSPLPPARIPPDLLRFGQPWIGRLGFLGFQANQPHAPAGDDDPRTITWLMASTRDRSLALLTGHLPPDGGRPGFSLRLITFLADGRVVVTADHPVTHRRPGHWSLVQRSFPTIEGQLHAHRRHLESVAGDAAAVLPAGDALVARVIAEDTALNEALVNSGDYRTSGEDLIRPVMSRLPAMAVRDLAAMADGLRTSSPGKKDVAKVRKDAAAADEEVASADGGFKLSLEQLVEQDIRRYRKHADQAPGLKHTVLRLAVLAATLFAFTAIFGRANIATTVGMLLGLIAVHEFGHWLMMKLCGYQRMGRFFVPFVGPIDRGRKLHAPAWQQLAVILAGPLPGLLAGMGVLVAGFFLPGLPLWLLDLGGLAVVLNAFYLLPFLPLDGGKVVDLLVFRDLPLLRPVFTMMSAVATLVASLLLKSRPLRFIAIGMFAGLAWDIRMIKVVRGGRRLGWAGAVDDENEALQKIFRGVREEDNDAFLRSHDWQRQIDVLLAEVLRKKPHFVTRFFGGGVYWWALILPFTIVACLFLTKFVGSTGQLNSLAKHVPEFRGQFPADQRSLNQEQYDAVTGLVATTREATNGSTGTPEELVALLGPEVTADLDKLDWTSAGIAFHGGEIDPTTLSVWLESLCGRLETALQNGHHTEALRRAELLLHGVNALEPASILHEREPLWDVQIRSLAAVEQLSASGKLDAATIQRLEARVNVLNKAPRPDVESVVMIDSWGRRQGETAMVLPESAGGTEQEFDARFWRLANPQSLQFFDNIRNFATSTPATITVGRHWKRTGKVGEIPAEPEENTQAAPGEAEFIAAFCESHRRVAWRRLTTLSALRLEAYRLKSGKLPDQWQHQLPGGASLTLVKTPGPCLKLEDKRDAKQRSVPEWLGSLESAAQAEHICPLNGAPPERSGK